MRDGLAGVFCAAIWAAALGLSACSPSAPAEGPASEDTWAREAAAQEAERLARQQRHLAESMEAVLQADAQVAAATSSTSQSRWQGMEAIDTSACPSDFRVAYYDHVNAWKDYIRGQSALARLNSEENVNATLAAGFVCELFDCSATPITDHVNTERRLNDYIAQANERIISTWRNVERVAIANGARLPAQ